MALPNPLTGDYLPIIKYDARAGKFIRIDRRPTAEGRWEAVPVEMPLPVVFLMDFSSLEIGWLCFKDGFPDLQMTPWSLEDQLGGIEATYAEQPTVDHRLGFRVLVMLKDAAGITEIRHFSHCSATVYRAYSGLHDRFLACAEAKEFTQCPVVRVAKTVPVKSKMGATNYEPVFEIVKWVERPAEFDAHQPAATVETYVHPDSTEEDELPF